MCGIAGILNHFNSRPSIKSLKQMQEALKYRGPDDFGIMQMGWCVYDPLTNIVSPIAGKILVFRTHDNKYAKVEILNFYDELMTNIYGGFYTFNYVYQPNQNTLNF